MELTLKSPIQYVPRVGPTMAKRLEKLGLYTAGDLLYYAPFRYRDYSLISPIASVQPGETVTVRGTVAAIKNIYTKHGKKIQQATVSDNSGRLEIIWFNQPFLIRTIKAGDNISLSGLVGWFGHKIVMESPEYEILTGGDSLTLHTGRLVPVYSETAGISSKWLRGRIAFVLNKCINQLFEYLPDTILREYGLPNIKDALNNVHFPSYQEEAQRARERLAFEELLLLQLGAYEQKKQWQETHVAATLKCDKETLNQFTAKLPFVLTDDQKQALTEIVRDIAGDIPMNRLLVGDVGSGKTVVAAAAMFVAYQSGKRAVLMAPTQILAQQHYQTIKHLLEPWKIKVDLVTAQQKTTLPKQDSRILIGTHALLSAKISLNNVGLVVIDEQQRFGVIQRSLMLEKDQKKLTPHLLTMTATPIPRTVARTIYSNLDLSVLKQMPVGRQKIKTWVVPAQKRPQAYTWIKTQLRQNHSQAFIVCPLIEESETLTSVKAATAEYARLVRQVFPGMHLGLLHGRLKAREKTEVLARFRRRELEILVTTPVVEVGIDIPGATIMLIEAAERFGLAQLHQLRGRVGRGTQPAYCLLFTESSEQTVLDRLKALETLSSGPELAELDLALRGPGEIFGTRQHGIPALKIATFTDSQMIHKTQLALKGLVDHDPTLSGFPLLREKLKQSKIEAVQD